MKTFRAPLKLIALSALALFAFTGCETTDYGGSAYYGVGFYDPWYHGGYYDDPDFIVTTPPVRPQRPPRVEQPIARPPITSPRPTPMPSIPSAPRPSMRR
jgi:hypothetical protein